MMRSNGMWRRATARFVRAAFLPACAALAAAAAPAAAQMSGELRYIRGYDLVPNPPLAGKPMTFVLYGVYPNGCGAIDETSVQDSAHVGIRLHSFACTDSTSGPWVATFPLGALGAGNHTVTFQVTVDRPDSGVTVYVGSLTYGVVDSTPPPPPPPPPPPLVTSQTTDPSPPTPVTPMALILGGHAPFACPVVSAATVVDTSHLAVTLSPGSGCPDTSNSWSHRFELGTQREGHHFLDLAITLEVGDSTTTYHVPVGFLVVNDSTPPAPQLLSSVTIDPWPPTPTTPMALILGGHAPFACPVVSAAGVVDTSHLAVTLSPGSGCPDASDSWSHRLELGTQREGHHFMDLAITLDVGDSATTYHFPVHFLVVHDSTGWGPPPDSLGVLSASRPNPFAEVSRFSVSLEEAADVDVAVFDINGRRVNRVFHGRLASGTRELSWNGRRADGSPAPSGIYFYRLSVSGRVISRRLVLLRQ